MSGSTADRDPIEMLADSFLVRVRRGGRPSVEEYAAKHPELADEIRELLPALVMLEQDKSAVRSATGTNGGPDATASGPAPHQLGDYLILREIGRGGMGVVFELVQQSLVRHVALEGAAPARAGRLDAVGAIPAGGTRRGAAAPHQHRAGLRRGRVRGGALLRHAVHPWAGPGCRHRRPAAAPQRWGAVHR